MLQETHDINHVHKDKESRNGCQQGAGGLNHSLPFREVTGVICKSLGWRLQSIAWKTQPQVSYHVSVNNSYLGISQPT